LIAVNRSKLAQNLIRIHKVITRALDIGLEKGNEYLESGFPPEKEFAGYSCYIQCLATVLSAHHISEDIITFPAFRTVLPNAPYARLGSDHHKISMLLASVAPAIKELAGESPETSLRSVIEFLTKIHNLWAPHIYLEEQYFSSDVLNSVMSPEDQLKISLAASKHSQVHSDPAYWVIPFLLYNLEKDDRQEMASLIPRELVEEMVPVVWKEKWEPMQPFLLE
jgi:hemerythrin-like domain-containing protein